MLTSFKKHTACKNPEFMSEICLHQCSCFCEDSRILGRFRGFFARGFGDLPTFFLHSSLACFGGYARLLVQQDKLDQFQV